MSIGLINPTPNSNYLINDKIMFGWYPTDPKSHGIYSNNIEHLISTGRNVFINLTTRDERSFLYKYMDVVASKSQNPIFIHYEIEDSKIPTDMKSFREFINLLVSLKDHNLYIHCRGGHGRSGVVAACLLINMGYSNEDALDIVSKSHKTREYIPNYPCPQTEEQILFVKSYSKNLIE